MKTRIKSLTGLRFLFVVFLFLHHLDAFYDCGIPGFDAIMRYLGEGAASVDFFFILSGFVIMYSYQQKVECREISAESFLFNRIAKLYPTHLLLWIIAAFIYGGKSYFIQHLLSKQFWTGAFLLQSYIPSDPSMWAFWGNGPSWSVSVEVFFYIAFIFLIRISPKERKVMWELLFAVILLNSVLLGNDTAISGWLYYINPLFRLLDFLSGMLLCEWMEKLTWRPDTTASATRLEVISLIILSVFVAISAQSGAFYNRRFQSYYYLIPCLCIIFAFSFDQGIFSKLLGAKVFQALGNCSFAFYLAHQLGIYVVKQVFRSRIVNLNTMWLYAGVAFVGVLGISLLLHYFFERPINQFAREIWQKRKEK